MYGGHSVTFFPDGLFKHIPNIFNMVSGAMPSSKSPYDPPSSSVNYPKVMHASYIINKTIAPPAIYKDANGIRSCSPSHIGSEYLL